MAEGSDELYQQAIRKYTQRVANNYLGGGSAHLYGAGNFDSEIFGVDPKQAEQDFDRLFPEYLKKTYTTKTGEAVVKKDEWADYIGQALGLTEADTESLTKANKVALAKIADFIKAEKA